jgi:hypothetical protein
MRAILRLAVAALTGIFAYDLWHGVVRPGFKFIAGKPSSSRLGLILSVAALCFQPLSS